MENKKWSDEDVQLLETMIDQEVPLKDIAKRLCRTPEAVGTKIGKLGIKTKYKNSINFKAVYQDYDWCYDNYVIKRYNAEEMANLCGASKRVIQKWCYKFGLTNRTMRDYIKLTDKQKELIMFSLLGDGHIDKRESQPLFIVSHAENQKDYLFWKYDILKNLCNKQPSYIKPSIKTLNNKEYVCQGGYRLCTRIISELKYIRDLSKKDIVDMINKFGLSIFFLDDGYCSNIGLWRLCIASFDEETKKRFRSVLYERFGICSNNCKDNRYIGFSKKDSEIISKIILSNVPNDLDIIKYKILKRTE